MAMRRRMRMDGVEMKRGSKWEKNEIRGFFIMETSYNSTLNSIMIIIEPSFIIFNKKSSMNLANFR